MENSNLHGLIPSKDQKILREDSLGWKKLLNFTCLTMKFHNCYQALSMKIMVWYHSSRYFRYWRYPWWKQVMTWKFHTNVTKTMFQALSRFWLNQFTFLSNTNIWHHSKFPLIFECLIQSLFKQQIKNPLMKKLVLHDYSIWLSKPLNDKR